MSPYKSAYLKIIPVNDISIMNAFFSYGHFIQTFSQKQHGLTASAGTKFTS